MWKELSAEWYSLPADLQGLLLEWLKFNRQPAANQKAYLASFPPITINCRQCEVKGPGRRCYRPVLIGWLNCRSVNLLETNPTDCWRLAVTSPDIVGLMGQGVRNLRSVGSGVWEGSVGSGVWEGSVGSGVWEGSVGSGVWEESVDSGVRYTLRALAAATEYHFDFLLHVRLASAQAWSYLPLSQTACSVRFLVC